MEHQINRKCQYGKIIGERFYVSRPKSISRAYNYPDDKVFEAHRIADNKRAFSLVARAIGVMRIEAKNGFRELTDRKQREVYSERKKDAESLLREGSFLEKELSGVRKRVNRLIRRTYLPYMKQ